jgi:dTDP-4-amino-4,6-dideoxygalactose transaminase
MNEPARLIRAFEREISSVMSAVARSGRWLNGPRVAAFAEAFADYLDVRYCVPVANGTDALELAMRAISASQSPQRKEAITVANAGGYASAACWQVGLVPVYADIVEETQLLDTGSVVAALNEKTSLIVATHLYGAAVDIPALRAAVDAAGYEHVPILEDCSQAHGAKIDGRMVGSFGRLATFSFYPTKNLGAIGDAGAVVTSDESLYAMVRQLHQYGWSDKYQVAIAGGRNSRMDELQAAVLLVLLPHLSRMNERRRTILAAYRAAAPRSVDFLRYTTDTVAHLAVALCPAREDFRRYLGEKGVATDIHYPILDCDQSGWLRLPQRIGPSGIDISRRSVERILSVPCFPSMTDGEVNQVVDALQEWGTA